MFRLLSCDYSGAREPEPMVAAGRQEEGTMPTDQEPEERTPENMPVGMLAHVDQLDAAQREWSGRHREELMAAAEQSRNYVPSDELFTLEELVRGAGIELPD